MKPATLKALRLSIAHWKRMAAGKSKGGEGPYSCDCALCKLFLYGLPDTLVCTRDGDRCPVYKSTGFTFCHRTPFRAAAIAYKKHDEVAFREAAKLEVKFLQSLLP